MCWKHLGSILFSNIHTYRSAVSNLVIILPIPSPGLIYPMTGSLYIQVIHIQFSHCPNPTSGNTNMTFAMISFRIHIQETSHSVCLSVSHLLCGNSTKLPSCSLLITTRSIYVVTNGKLFFCLQWIIVHYTYSFYPCFGCFI